jgi:hypothetical protein
LGAQGGDDIGSGQANIQNDVTLIAHMNNKIKKNKTSKQKE